MGVYHPLGYHGTTKTADFFEGWYIKCHAANLDTIAIVPGIFRSRSSSPEHSHAFIFVNLNGVEQAYYRFPVEAFHGDAKNFVVSIDGPSGTKNHFSSSGISVDLAPQPGDDAKMTVRGQLEFAGTVQWPITRFSPGVMGLVAFMPRVECYHGIVSMDHSVTGSLALTGASVDALAFDGSAQSHGYLEKDYGQKFPSSWVWLQTNNFPDLPAESGPVSLFFSVAQVPYFGTSFPGFICGFLHEGKLHRFSSYLLSRFRELRVDKEEKTLYARVANWSYTLTIESSYKDVPFVPLYGPHPPTAKMEITVPEAVRAEVKITLAKRWSGKVVFQGTGVCAGLEVQGDIAKLAKGIKSWI